MCAPGVGGWRCMRTWYCLSIKVVVIFDFGCNLLFEILS